MSRSVVQYLKENAASVKPPNLVMNSLVNLADRDEDEDEDEGEQRDEFTRALKYPEERNQAASGVSSTWRRLGPPAMSKDKVSQQTFKTAQGNQFVQHGC